MVYLHMSTEADKDTGFPEKACDKYYPIGLLYVSWSNFHTKNAKTEIFPASKLRQEFQILNLNKEGDPANFFENIATIKMKTRKLLITKFQRNISVRNLSLQHQRCTCL